SLCTCLVLVLLCATYRTRCSSLLAGFLRTHAVPSSPTRRSSDLLSSDTRDDLVYSITVEPVFGRVGLAGGDDDDFFQTKTSRVGDRKSTRLNSSHVKISYAVFCLKKNKRLNASHC